MFSLADVIVFCCLWGCGLNFGYYVKYTYVYDNLWQHWFALLGGVVALALSLAWTLRKQRKQCYSYDHYYIIFYGLLCALLSSCFLLTKQLVLSFYFSFIGLGIIFVASFSYISLRSAATGKRPARIALGNATYAGGLCCGFAIFNEFELQDCGLISLVLTLVLLLLVGINELLQHLGLQDYKQSPDLAFNLLNEERLTFLPPKAIYAQFVGRNDYRMQPQRWQWRLLLLLGGLVLLLQRCSCLHSCAFLQLMWSATAAYLERMQLYAPFAFYAVGCALGALLLLRYTPKLLYLLFGIIEMTLMVALLCIYDEEQTQHCFFFLCLIYSNMGLLASYALQWLLECTPFLYTELAVGLGYALQLATLELYKYETRVQDVWPVLFGSGLANILLTLLSVVLVQWLMPRSTSLVDTRNQLLGIRRVHLTAAQTQFWHTNQFLAHDKQPYELQSVQITKERIFQQYPANTKY